MTTANRRLNRVSRDEILDLGDYERARDRIRPDAIAARKLRRVSVGPSATVAFENRLTVVYQIQEMLRAERIAKDAEVQHEIETYSDLLPSADELSATVMLEIPAESERSVRLADLRGFEDHFRLEIDGAGAAITYFDRRQIDPEKLSAVQFVRFALTPEQRDALEAGAQARLVADHPKYAHAATIPRDTMSALLDDLREAGE